MEDAVLQNQFLEATAGDGAVAMAMEGADLQNQSLEAGRSQLVPALRILIAQHRHLCHHALVKRRGMEDADSHKDCLGGMVGAGPPLAHRCLVQMMMMMTMTSHAVKETEGVDIHKEQREFLAAMEGAAAVVMEGVDSP
jgi:hypothetical protein